MGVTVGGGSKIYVLAFPNVEFKNRNEEYIVLVNSI